MFKKFMLIPVTATVLALSACSAAPMDMLLEAAMEEFAEDEADEFFEDEIEESSESGTGTDEPEDVTVETSEALIDDLMKRDPEGGLPDNLIDDLMEEKPAGRGPDHGPEDMPPERPEGMKPGAREGHVPQMPSEDTIRGILEDMEICDEDIEKIISKVSEMGSGFTSES